MKIKGNQPGPTAPSIISGKALRKEAEDIFWKKPAQLSETLEVLSAEETRQTLYELRVHQIELETQNEELQRTKAELEAARERYFDLYDLAPVGYCTVSEQRLILEANLTTATLLGVTRGALVKQPITRFIIKDDHDTYYLHLKQLFETGEPQAFELQMVENDGTQFWAQLVATVAQGVDGALAYRVVLSDITERKLAEESLRESEAKYRSLFENAVEGVFQTTPEGRFISANPSLAKLFGYDSPQEYMEQITDIGRQQYVQPEDRQTYKNTLEREGVIKGFEVQLINKEGNPVWASISARSVRDNKKTVLYYEGTVENINERKGVEAYMKTSLREKEILLKEIHHRVKNNLQVISSLLNMQSAHIKDPQALDMFRDSIHRIRTMAHIHETLYRSKDYGQINFCGYIDELSSQLYSSYGLAPESVTLTTSVANIFLDLNTAIPLGLIINELVSNAMKHAFPDGRKGEIMISMKTEEGCIVLSVSDNGIGFPPHIDFNNTDSLGLQLVIELTEQIVGTIKLLKDNGTQVIITFSID